MLNEWMNVMFMFQIKIGLFKNISVGLLLDKKIEYKGHFKVFISWDLESSSISQIKSGFLT